MKTTDELEGTIEDLRQEVDDLQETVRELSVDIDEAGESIVVKDDALSKIEQSAKDAQRA